MGRKRYLEGTQRTDGHETELNVVGTRMHPRALSVHDLSNVPVLPIVSQDLNPGKKHVRGRSVNWRDPS